MAGKWILSKVARLTHPAPARDWEHEYADGAWSLLSGLDEMSRYWIATGYCSLIRNPSILDVGCGPGLLEQKLRLLPYGSYTGTDISPSALREARRQMPPESRLICSDFNQIAVAATFDRIVFMESMEPQLPVIDILRKHVPLLGPDGRIVLSLFDGKSGIATGDLWKAIAAQFRIEDATHLHNLPSGKRWTVGLLAPRQ